ncbi:MAG: DHH family phosphoesterase [Aphanizomenon sp.]|jgi:nanoRNase/pAp phosphatase (c-di-AMP/oligoRNAs hydrolase)|uniref:Exopolyphosphatase-like protein n=2 Tax=Aphanizomenon flos-aquae TaxID=1176 RepID=A0A1B7W258_APHFL|nr:bifunctional oligoribonuclease/PAP phosphatase NrnA [Aphanizomenon flos-aquae UKL13-PB]MBO1059932.1 bifunctional oligoribonuclease/PAP phosphatase NrnA [Aphanizomenon flos-aquae CP01]OBQ27364.1 MAG: exopolyphosphatase-like protein [Aphanizomenon flos-aquae LD13]OBQ30358.1 MAG: exopolyphosphatase-like protein [Aphanizomenon flos-aquae MDT14a]QSV68118.1 MAG: bifunctional oligoribonuclease/PAP phosphatase NrnA [Aphanizomenon flos-aquae DEX188]HCQ22998.1 exopolyphosphatase-like protein [Anabaen
MYVNYPPSQLESLSLTTEPNPEEIEKQKEKELIELPPRTSLPSSNGDGGMYLVQRSSSLATQKSEELQKTLRAHRHERQLVILQDFPDPDALSCAWSYQLIAQQYDIKCDIVYAGTLSHQENIALVKLTNLPAQRWTMQTLKNKDLSSYQGFVLIDNQGTTSQLLPAIQQAGIPLIVLVDHHSLQGELKSEFVDVRPYVRATATIFTQYLQVGLLSLDNSISQHVKCATALMHGLRSDTNRLMQAQEEDFMAAGYLSKFYDAQLLNAILQANRSKRVMDVIERSLKNRIVQNNFSIAGVGYLRYDDRDAIPQAADFLVTEENVHTAVVYGIVHDEDDELEVVIGSLRTTKLTLDPDEFIKEAFGQDSAGRFFGGGRTGAGGFEIPMGFLSGGNENSAYAKIKWDVFDAQIKQKLLRLVNPRDNPIQS